MNPKNVDRGGKGILIAANIAIVYAVKKYGPSIINGAGKVLKKMIFRR